MGAVATWVLHLLCTQVKDADQYRQSPLENEVKMDKDMKKFLRRMIENGGFIANGVYSDDIHYWHSNTAHSKSLMDIVLFHTLRSNGYIRQDRTGRYYPTEKGRQFAMPWYKKIFDVI